MRTIIDLPEEQLQRLDAFARDEGISRAAAVRAAVDLLLDQKRRDRDEWLGLVKATAGVWKDRRISTDEYLNELRSEWER